MHLHTRGTHNGTSSFSPFPQHLIPRLLQAKREHIPWGGGVTPEAMLQHLAAEVAPGKADRETTLRKVITDRPTKDMENDQSSSWPTLLPNW